MLTAVAKYRHVFAVGLQSGLIYRWNFLTRVIFSLLHLVIVAVYWKAAYAGEQLIGDFTFEQTMSYFLGVLISNYLISAMNEDFQIGEEIRSGTINQFITKPVDYFAYRLTLFFSSRFVTSAIVAIPLALLVLFGVLDAYLPHNTTGVAWLAAVPAFFMAALIQFSIAFCFGLLAFWFLEIQGFVILSFAVETLLSGQVFPLDLMPPALQKLSAVLPFYYQTYFPVAIATGRITETAEIQQGLLIQLLWTGAFMLGGRLLWRAGLRRHTAVGG